MTGAHADFNVAITTNENEKRNSKLSAEDASAIEILHFIAGKSAEPPNYSVFFFEKGHEGKDTRATRNPRLK